MAKALIVVDMQNDFVKGHMSTPEAREIVGYIREKAASCRENGDVVLFTLDTHLDEDYTGPGISAEAALLPRHCIKGTGGWEIIGELQPLVRGDAFEKPTFLGLGLEDAILGRSEGAPVDEIELCGVCTDICVISNALYLRARFPDAKIVVDSAACAGLNPQAHKAALTAMGSCLVNVL